MISTQRCVVWDWDSRLEGDWLVFEFGSPRFQWAER